jgi:hypothetical protein
MNPLEQFDLAALAADTGHSYTRIIHAFRAQTALSPYKYIFASRARPSQNHRCAIALFHCWKLLCNQTSRAMHILLMRFVSPLDALLATFNCAAKIGKRAISVKQVSRS